MTSDTVSVEIRNNASPYNVIEMRKAVLNDSGKGNFNYTLVTDNTPYYIAVKHRNTIETWSSAGVSFVSSVAQYNFTDASSRSYGNNAVQINSRFAFYSGDVDQDDIIDLSDLTIIDNDASNFQTGYINSDVNGDTLADLADMSISDNNAFNVITIIRP